MAGCCVWDGAIDNINDILDIFQKRPQLEEMKVFYEMHVNDNEALWSYFALILNRLITFYHYC